MLKSKLLYRDSSKHIPNTKDPFVYLLESRTEHTDNSHLFKRCEVGERISVPVNEKVVIFLGASGAGKTTMINSLINFILDVDIDDPFRFKLIDERNDKPQGESQTEWITAYTLYHRPDFRLPYTLTIVDTPGFGDTGGIERDREIMKQIEFLFSAQDGKGIDCIDVVAFVCQASLSRLGPADQYIIDSVLTLFGKDVGDNIYLLCSFADDKKPKAVRVLREAGVPFKKYFKMNNSAVFGNDVTFPSGVENESEDDESDDEYERNKILAKVQFEICSNNFQKFFDTFSTVETKSVVQTQNVLRERASIEVCLEGINHNITMGVSKLEELNETKKVVKDKEADIERNRDFKFAVPVATIQVEELKSGMYVTNCTVCNTTCHFPCKISNDDLKNGCYAMDPFTHRCLVCVGKCFWDKHKNMPYRYVAATEIQEKTSDELYTNYRKAVGQKEVVCQMLANIQQECDELEGVTLEFVKNVKGSLQRLKELALKQDSTSVLDYMDVLILREENACRKGFKERIKHLEDMKKRAKLLKDVSDGSFMPFGQYNNNNNSNIIDAKEIVRERLKNINNEVDPGTSSSTGKRKEKEAKRDSSKNSSFCELM